MKSDLEIARQSTLKPIEEISDRLTIPRWAVKPIGHDKAKISLTWIAQQSDLPNGKLILVTGITPTAAGEGKTTTTVGLGDAMNAIGKNSLICLREPSLGPCFGSKGGAAGGGYAQVVPMEDINLHFTGDFHAIGAANNLLAAMVDNHIYWGNQLQIDPRRITWRRGLDMNDRALRQITASLGGTSNGFPREDGFDITVASEVMAIFCLSQNLEDLKRRLGKIIIGYTRELVPVYARDLNAEGAMTALLRDSMQPNLVQTLENNPAMIHGGPFANIAHGCNSVIATKTALKLADYVITEAGFGADLGAEKFFDIKCRKAGLLPDAAVVVATVRALKLHGGVAKDALTLENCVAVKSGIANLLRHATNVKKFGIPIIVALNRFTSDTELEVETVYSVLHDHGIDVVECTHWKEGSKGAINLANKISEMCNGKKQFKTLYPSNMPLWNKIETIACEIYGAEKITADQKLRLKIERLQSSDAKEYPVCIAKTQYSFSSDPTLIGAPKGFSLPIREIRLSNGAEFVVALCGNIMTMPGLPRVPAAESIGIRDSGEIFGLF